MKLAALLWLLPVFCINSLYPAALDTGVSDFLFRPDEPSILKFSPDGSCLAVADSLGQILIIDVKNSSRKFLFIQAGRIINLDFSTDNKYLAAAVYVYESFSVTAVWNLVSGEKVLTDDITAKYDRCGIKKVAFLPDAHILGIWEYVSGCCGFHVEGIHFINVDTGKKYNAGAILFPELKYYNPEDISFSRERRVIHSLSRNGWYCAWDIFKKAPVDLLKVPAPEDKVRISHSLLNNRLAYMTESGLEWIDLENRTTGSTDIIPASAERFWITDKNSVLYCDKQQLFMADTGKNSRTLLFKMEKSRETVLDYCEQQRTMCLLSGNRLLIFGINNWKQPLLAMNISADSFIESIAVDGNDRLALTLAGTNRKSWQTVLPVIPLRPGEAALVPVADAQNPAVLSVLKEYALDIPGDIFSAEIPEAGMAVDYSFRNSLSVEQYNAGKSRLIDFRTSFNYLWFSITPDKRYLAMQAIMETTDDYFEYYVIRMDNGQIAASAETNLKSRVFYRSSNNLLFLSSEKALMLYSPALPGFCNLGSQYAFQVALDGTLLAVSLRNGNLVLLDTAGFKRIMTIERSAEEGLPAAIAFTKDNAFCCLTGNSGKLFFYRVADGKLISLAELLASGQDRKLRFSAPGKGSNNRIAIMPINSPGEIPSLDSLQRTERKTDEYFSPIGELYDQILNIKQMTAAGDSHGTDERDLFVASGVDIREEEAGFIESEKKNLLFYAPLYYKGKSSVYLKLIDPEGKALRELVIPDFVTFTLHAADNGGFILAGYHEKVLYLAGLSPELRIQWQGNLPYEKEQYVSEPVWEQLESGFLLGIRNSDISSIIKLDTGGNMVGNRIFVYNDQKCRILDVLAADKNRFYIFGVASESDSIYFLASTDRELNPVWVAVLRKSFFLKGKLFSAAGRDAVSPVLCITDEINKKNYFLDFDAAGKQLSAREIGYSAGKGDKPPLFKIVNVLSLGNNHFLAALNLYEVNNTRFNDKNALLFDFPDRGNVITEFSLNTHGQTKISSLEQGSDDRFLLSGNTDDFAFLNSVDCFYSSTAYPPDTRFFTRSVSNRITLVDDKSMQFTLQERSLLKTVPITTGLAVLQKDRNRQLITEPVNFQETDWLAARQKSTVSSFLYSNWFSYAAHYYHYHPAKAFDNDPATGWLEHSAGGGIGDFIGIRLETTIIVDTIQFMPGYFDSRWYNNNNRIAGLDITLNGRKYAVQFKDEKQIQEFRFPSPVAFNSITFTITAVYSSGVDDDTALSEIQFFYRGEMVQLDLSRVKHYFQKVSLN